MWVGIPSVLFGIQTAQQASVAVGKYCNDDSMYIHIITVIRVGETEV